MEVDICIYAYAYFLLLLLILDLLRSTFYVSYLMTYLMIELPTCLGIQLRGLHIQHISQHRNAFLSHAQPRVSMRVHAYPYMSIYTYLIDVSRHKL